jgi:cobalamin biosynthesis Mg chelatase CobN
MQVVTKIYQDAFLTVTTEAGRPWMHLAWKGEQSNNSVIEGCEQIHRLMTEHRLYRLLNDATHASGNWSKAAVWLVYDWLPRMKTAGMECCAHVFGIHPGARMSASASLLLFDPTRENFRAFREVEAAKRWLLEFHCA